MLEWLKCEWNLKYRNHVTLPGIPSRVTNVASFQILGTFKKTSDVNYQLLMAKARFLSSKVTKTRLVTFLGWSPWNLSLLQAACGLLSSVDIYEGPYVYKLTLTPSSMPWSNAMFLCCCSYNQRMVSSVPFILFLSSACESSNEFLQQHFA